MKRILARSRVRLRRFRRRPTVQLAGFGFCFVFLAVFLAFSPDDYDRSNWPHWSAGDVYGDKRDTRVEVLIERAEWYEEECKWRRCRITAGEWIDEYTGEPLLAMTARDVSNRVTLDHAIPLAEAHRSGGWSWSRAQRREFANFKPLLFITSRSNNSARRDSDVYMPPVATCDFVKAYITGKQKFGLLFDLREASFYLKLWKRCGSGLEVEQ